VGENNSGGCTSHSARTETRFFLDVHRKLKACLNEKSCVTRKPAGEALSVYQTKQWCMTLALFPGGHFEGRTIIETMENMILLQ
jgi:hypothetical protein